MTTPRVYLACLWGGIVLFALYNGIAHGSAVAWWLLVALVPALVVFVWWMADRAALERRIKRLEARSEIGDERRIVAHADLTNVERQLHEIETRVAQVEDNEAGAIGGNWYARAVAAESPPWGLAGRDRVSEEMRSDAAFELLPSSCGRPAHFAGRVRIPI